MALPDAPTITTEEELNKLLAQIQGGMTPPTIKRDAFGNIVVTQNGEATMVPLTLNIIKTMSIQEQIFSIVHFLECAFHL